eukprot:scaffold4804_cov53-Phaeocystis_antarctica.AAC.1
MEQLGAARAPPRDARHQLSADLAQIEIERSGDRAETEIWRRSRSGGDRAGTECRAPNGVRLAVPSARLRCVGLGGANVEWEAEHENRERQRRSYTVVAPRCEVLEGGALGASRPMCTFA